MPLNLGDKAVDFELPGVDGKTHRLSDHQDKPVIAVAFWCNHCPYVQAWEPRVVELGKEYGPKGVQFLLVNSNETENYPTDDFPHMVERAKSKGYPFPYLRDETQEVAKAYGATRTPELFVFDRARRLVYHGAPDDNHESAARVTKHYLKDALDALLAGKNPVVAETAPKGCSVKWAT